MSEKWFKMFEQGFSVAVATTLFFFIWKAGQWFGKHFVLVVVDALKAHLKSSDERAETMEKLTSSIAVTLDHNTNWLKKNALATDNLAHQLKDLAGETRDLIKLHHSDSSNFATVKCCTILEALKTKMNDMETLLKSKLNPA